MAEQKRVRLLDAEVARKIAAGEVIDRPNAIIRELMDNAVDSGATKIDVEIEGGGIEKIRVVDNGCGMSKEDLMQCARPHATSKISTETDLLHLSTLGFRGEALSSMAAVSRLEIISGGNKMNASVTEDHLITPTSKTEGTIVQTKGLFENFPARRQFLKRPASEGIMCRGTFEEKVLPRPDIAFTFTSEGEEKLNLPAGQTLKERFVQVNQYFENEELFYEITEEKPSDKFSFTLIIGEPSVTRSSRKDISIYVNGRKIQEYSLIQAIVYGIQGYFPNGSFPVACLFVQIDSSLVDFNIHPAKREARFKDINSLHHEVSTATRNFFRQYTVKTMLAENEAPAMDNSSIAQLAFNTDISETNKISAFETPDLYFEEKNSVVSKYTIKSPADTSVSYVDVKRSSGNFSSSSPSGNRTKFFGESSPLSKEPRENFMSEVSYKPNFIPDNFAKSNIEKEEDGFHFVGCTMGTFLIAEKNGILYIIDQHAAHERMLYDRLMAEAKEKQNLLVPYTIQTDSEADDKYIEAIKDKLKETGFECKNCGNGRWEFSTVPARWKGKEEDLKKDVLDRRVNPADIMNSVIASTACRTAVMDGTVLDNQTAAEIARGALELPDPHCPHGRPVFTTITRTQLFSLVKRT
ncbi:DNA mismatch repair endonuclease MutL [Treponema sp.]|uniref:DNA mismatch repair endonuclease MutL n=1 Tax=Treponema sp. TaxID=166 RepID=UPI002A8060C8|nr:DNA mismatch repair endonuclease MutL [Treponema sp.]MCI6441637.1 DNA mismatch repair endonuclease MutL [Spirochaetia bacterium]MDY4132505.1 DNA mismatch repair endonuclease MutL [Treponema sp.]